MTFKEKILAPFAKKQLKKTIAATKRTRSTHNFWTARTVAIFFDAEKMTDRTNAANFARALEKEGKKVRLLGYFHQNKLETQPTFEFFLKKNTSILGEPKAENAIKFSKEKFDLLLVFNPLERWAIEHLAAATTAAMKIGTLSTLPNNFDFMLEMPQNTTFQTFLEQLDIYLEKIIPVNVQQNESAFAKI